MNKTDKVIEEDDHIGVDGVYHCQNCGHHHCLVCSKCHRCGCGNYLKSRGEANSARFRKKYETRRHNE